MPELPEVETVRRDLVSAGVLGKTITGTTIGWERTLGGMSATTFEQRMLNRSFCSLDRRGKYLVFTTDDGQTMLIHLRMSGSVSLRASDAPSDIHDRVSIRFNDHDLVFHDPRKFGRVLLTRSPQAILGKLGPEPLSDELDAGVFHKKLNTRGCRIKTLLLDQSFIAGIGNIYADESLFMAALDPCRPAKSLTMEESSRLLKSIKDLLASAIANRGTSLGNGEGNFASDGKRGNHASGLNVFRKMGFPCPRCGTPIERTIVAQRSTHYCPTCQR